MSLLYWGSQTWMQHLRCVSQGLSREEGSPPQHDDNTLANATKDGYCWLSLLHGHIAGSCSAQCLMGPAGPFLQGCLPASQSQPVGVHKVIPSQVLVIPPTLRTSHFPLNCVPVSPFFQLVEVPLNDYTPIWCINYSSQFCIICKLAGGVLCPIIQIITKKLNSSGCHIDA